MNCARHARDHVGRGDQLNHMRTGNTEMNINIINADNLDQVEQAGFARFNDGQHVCVEVPNGKSTISCKLPDGQQITFAFVPYTADGCPQCVDVQVHGKDATVQNGSASLPVQDVIAFGVGHDTFRSEDGKRPTTLVTHLLHR